MDRPWFLGNQGRTREIRSSFGMESAHPTPPEYWVIGPDEVRDTPELEPVDSETQKWITADANQAHATRGSIADLGVLQGERAQLGNVLARHEEVARNKGLNVSSDIRVIQRRLDAIDKKLGF